MVGVDLIVPETMRMVFIVCTSIILVCTLLSQIGAAYSAAEHIELSADVCRVSTVDPHEVPHNFCRMFFLVLILAEVFVKLSLNVSVLPSVTLDTYGLIWLFSKYILSFLVPVYYYFLFPVYYSDGSK